MSNSGQFSRSHLVLIPSYNSGSKLEQTIHDALAHWQPVCVIVDGSTDGSKERLENIEAHTPGLRVLCLPRNQGKGAAVLHGMGLAHREGFQFALTMDSDGQHSAARIPEFMKLSAENPDAMILGVPQFGPDAPGARKLGRRLGNFWTHVETRWGGIGDSLFGFRVYPIRESIGIMQRIRGGRRFDFDTQLAVRLYWGGVRPINVPVPVRYFTPEQGGVSHFQYIRDNALLVWTHLQLVAQAPLRRALLNRRKKQQTG